MPMSPRQRVLIIAAFVLVVALIAFALYSFFFKPFGAIVPTVPPTTEPQPTGGLPIAPEAPLPELQPTQPGVLRPTPPPSGISAVAEGGLTATNPMLPTGAREVKLRADGRGVNYYNALDGKFYRVTTDGTLNQLSSNTFAQVENATWSPQGNKAVLEFPDGSNIFFDFDSQQQATLPAHWKDFDFDPSGDKIVSKSIGTDEQDRYLIVSDTNGSGARVITALGNQEQFVTPTWSPSGQVVALAETGFPTHGSAGDRQNIYLVPNRQTTDFPQITIEGYGLRSQWSPDGNQMLYSAYNATNEYKPHLWVVTTQPGNEGASKVDLGLNTWADKCAFADTTTLYCAVPVYLEQGFGMVPGLADAIPDEIYKIDLNDGTKTLIASPVESPTIETLMVSEDGDSLFFVDKQDQGLFEMRLR